MLTSERAALAKATQLFNQLSENNHFQDDDFGPRNDKDQDGSAKAMYREGKIPSPGYPEPNTIKWARAQEICEKGTSPQFVDDGAGSNDVRQGALGDCWFIGAMSVIVSRDELLRGGCPGIQLDKNMIIDKELAAAQSKGVYPPIFHRFRLRGIYVLRFFKNFQWVYVIVDDRLPVNKDSN